MMSPSQPPKPPGNSQGDSRLESFLRKAGPIIASERGLNAKSRIKLVSLANDMHLPDELFDEALRTLKTNPPQEKRKFNRWERSFAKFIRSEIKKISGGILTADMEKKALEIGGDKYQLSDEQSRDVLQTVTSELGVGRISVSDAERHVEQVVKELVDDSAWIDDDKRKRLHSLGHEWGVSLKQVETLITTFTRQNMRRQTSEKRTTNLFIGAGVAIALAVLGIFVFFSMSNRTNTAGTDSNNSSDGETDPSGQRAGVGVKVTMPDWWDQELKLRIVKARVQVKDFEVLYPQLASPNIANRTDAYRQLALMTTQSLTSSESLERLKTLIAALVAAEPENECLEGLIGTLLEQVPPPEDQLPSHTGWYDRSFWIVKTIVDILPEDDRLKARRNLIHDRLTEVTQASTLNTYGRRELEQRHLRGISERLYENLVENSDEEVNHLIDCHLKLRVLADRYFDQSERINLDARLMVAILESQTEAWAKFRTMLKLCIEHGASGDLMLLLDVYETTEDDGLQNYLGEQFVSILKTIPTSSDPDAIAAAVRRQIGASAIPVEANEAVRWARFKRQVRKLSESDTHQLAEIADAQQLADIARFATMACALAQGESGYAAYDRVSLKSHLEPTPGLETPSRGLEGLFPTRRKATAFQRETFEKKIARLASWKELSSRSRFELFRTVGNDVGRFDEIEPKQGAVIADYLLGGKEDSEFTRTLSVLSNVSQWNYVLLAVADAVPESQLADSQTLRIAFELMKIPQDISPSEEWQIELQRRLIEFAMERLENRDSMVGVSDLTNFGWLQEQLATAYLERVQILDGDQSGNATPPGFTGGTSEAVETAIAAVARQLRGSAIKEETRVLVDNIEKQTATAHYVGQNSLDRTVRMQRIMIELVAAKVGIDRRELSVEISMILNKLSDNDESSINLTQQLKTGERALLDLWLLYSP